MAHKGKVTSNVFYNSEDEFVVYNNPIVYSRLIEYTAKT
jgi:hypothetical protein